ncbi:hypothetical protein GCM10009759_56300 [Kitasatospora saccharophila]|uniref:Uncharacterized protein n=1 Tax=Kitasatospora saccharophila TaxID=407973 RepID=A0ABN2XJZ3_9ACTN
MGGVVGRLAARAPDPAARRPVKPDGGAPDGVRGAPARKLTVRQENVNQLRLTKSAGWPLLKVRYTV